MLTYVYLNNLFISVNIPNILFIIYTIYRIENKFGQYTKYFSYPNV